MKITEDNFIHEIKNKNEDGLYYLIREYGWIIKTIINKHLFYLEEYKEECFNDCLLAIWENIDSYDNTRASFKNWIGVIAKHRSIDYMRKYLKHRDILNIDNECIKTEDNIIDNLLKMELEKELEDMLKNLSEEDREIFKSYYFEDRSINEIARDKKMNESVIYNRLSRGRKKIRDKYK